MNGATEEDRTGDDGPVRTPRHADDAGGMWIRIGIIGGLLIYAGVVVMAAAGFTEIIPFVIIPPILVALIGANSLVGGGRRRRPEPAPRPLGTPLPTPPVHDEGPADQG